MSNPRSKGPIEPSSIGPMIVSGSFRSRHGGVDKQNPAMERDNMEVEDVADQFVKEKVHQDSFNDLEKDVVSLDERHQPYCVLEG